MRLSHAPALSVAPPSIDPIEARWAAEAVASLSRQLDDDSVVGMVLRQAHRELTSLTNSRGTAEPDVIGPIRIRLAA